MAKLKTTVQKNPLKTLGTVTVHPIQNPVDDTTDTAANTGEFEMVPLDGPTPDPSPAPAAPADEADAGAIMDGMSAGVGVLSLHAAELDHGEFDQCF